MILPLYAVSQTFPNSSKQQGKKLFMDAIKTVKSVQFGINGVPFDSLQLVNGVFVFYKAGIGYTTGGNSGTVIDTTFLSNRINLRLRLSDSAAMLNHYAKLTAVALKVNISDTASMLTNLKNNINLRVKIADTATMLTNVKNNIALRVKISDTAAMLTHIIERGDTASMLNHIKTNIGLRVKISDTASMLTNIKNNVSLRLKIADTATMFTHLIERGDTASMLLKYKTALGVRIKVADTASMLNHYAKAVNTELKSNKVTSFSTPTDIQYPSAKLVSDQLNLHVNISDTAAMLAHDRTAIGVINSTLASGTELSGLVPLKADSNKTSAGNYATTGYVLSHAGSATDTTSLSNRINSKISADYIIEKIGSTYYARPKGTYVAYSGTSFKTVIENAISQLTSGGIVYISAGLYDNLDFINITENNISIIGAGKYFTKLKLKASADVGRTINQFVGLINTGTVNHFTIKDIELDGNGANQTVIDSGTTMNAVLNGIFDQHSTLVDDYITIDNCYVLIKTTGG